MKVLFFGTSHCAMFHEAWEHLPQKARADWTPEFFAAPAPMLAKAMSESDRLIDGTWRHQSPDLNSYMNRLGNALVDEVPFGEFDRVVFVDMFCFYDSCHLTTSNGEYGLMLDGVPVSRSAWNTALRSAMCVAEYSNHPRVGDVLPTSLLPLIEAATMHVQPENLFITPRPMLPSQRLVARYGSGLQGKKIGEYARWYDEIARGLFEDIGVIYVPRPPSSICEQTGGSLDEFSKGWLDEAKTKLNEHLSRDYAIPILNDIFLRTTRN